MRPAVKAGGGPDLAAIFGMETPSAWSTVTPGAVLGQSSTHSQGSYSLSVRPSNSNGFTPIKSVALTTLPVVSPTLAVDIMLPTYQPNPQWYGTAQAYIDCPSRGIYSQFLGQVELTGKPLGVWNTVNFTLTNTWIAGLLQAGYSDLTITVVLNVQVPTTGIYFIDNLRFAPVATSGCGGRPNGTSCTDNTACTVGDTCQSGTCHPGTAVICTASDSCHSVGTCNSTTGNCSNPAKPAGTVCRPAVGPCDVQEVCDGAGGGCPPDGLLPASTVCRPSAGACDVAEVCSGTSPSCPPDGYLQASMECRPSAGACDVAEVCSGTGPDCPPDVFLAAETICRASTGLCDPAETCSGSDATCPADVATLLPAAPTGLATSSGPGAVTLTWTGSPSAITYTVKRGTASGGPYSTIASNISSTSYVDHSVPSASQQYGATTYYYVVTASNTCGESAASNQASGNSGVLTPPRRLPAPPADPGCYVGTPSGWATVQCTPPEQMDPRFLENGQVTQPAIESVPVSGTTIPFQFAQLDATFIALGGVEKDGGRNNTLSLQLNTNHFDNDADGHSEEIQFILKSVGQTPGFAPATRICIEPVDRTVACAGTPEGQPCNGNGYLPKSCVGGGTSGQMIGNLTRDFLPFDFATMAATTYQGKIGLVAQFSWFDSANDWTQDGNGRGLYSVVADDTLGLGLPDKWKTISGTFIGFAGGSRAQFVDYSSVLTRMLGGSCYSPGTGPFPGIPWPGVCNDLPVFLPYTSQDYQALTVEDNNLSIVGSPTPLVSYEPDLVFTEFLASTDGTCREGSALAYVKDFAEDTGIIPTNIGGQPFWQSPDILFVLPDQTADENTTARGSLINFGQTYKFYVRVHNDFGCNDVTGVKARLFVAEPSGLMQEWQSITGDDYVIGPTQDADNSGGITVKARQAAVIGPFTWTAPQGTGSTHKCLLAAIKSDHQDPPSSGNDPLPAAYLSNQVAQRNVQFEDCAWQLPATQAGLVTITLNVSGATPALQGNSNIIQVTVDDPNGTWATTKWNSPSPAGSYSATYNGNGKTVVRLGQSSVKLPDVPIAAGASPVASVTITNVMQTTSVDFHAKLSTSTGSDTGNTCTYVVENPG